MNISPRLLIKKPGKREYSCEQCHAVFFDWPSNRRWNHNFCTRSCQGKWKFTKSNPAKIPSVKEILRMQKLGSRNPRFGKAPWNKDKVGVQVAWNKGKENPLLRGENNPNWKGGITPEVRKIRNSTRYQDWRRAVFIRDGFRCVLCFSKGYLNADHIKPFSLFPELRFEVNNGRTLCISCHKKTDTYGGRCRIYS